MEDRADDDDLEASVQLPTEDEHADNHGRAFCPLGDEEDHDDFGLSMHLANVLRDDIQQISCLTCEEVEPSFADHATTTLCPCSATLHPFCSIFHNWIRLRLTGACSSSPASAISIPSDERVVESSDSDAASVPAEGSAFPTPHLVPACAAVLDVVETGRSCQQPLCTTASGESISEPESDSCR